MTHTNTSSSSALVPLDHRGIKGKGEAGILDPDDSNDKEKVDAVICDDVRDASYMESDSNDSQ